MVSTRNRAQALDIPASPKRKKVRNNEDSLGYEKCRDERIKENLERMQKLGIADLSLKLKFQILSSSRRVLPKSPSDRKTPDKLALPSRRSSRLQSVSPVSYAEIPVKKNEKSDNWPVLVEGRNEEVYTEEHDKLLGTCEMSWVPFVDGYDKEGMRIYDPVNGKTCHQCRQKTLGHRTHCIKCNMGQGQFCGDCLYLRYGENVLEVNNNPRWICPVCRGICNCSLCRIKKGWAPTGALAKKVLSLGFKSVAHYLIQTRRSQVNSEELDSVQPSVTSKRSLAFTDTNDSFQPKSSLDSEKLEFYEKNSNGNQESELQSTDKHIVSNVGAESNIKLRNKSKKTKEPAFIVKRSSDSIAGRLRKRHYET